MTVLEPGVHRPMPRPSWLTVPFWAAAAEGRLIVQRCEACRQLFFRPEAACPHCLSQRWHWAPVTGAGSVHSFTVVYRPAIPEMVVPYAVADIALVEGVHMMSNIVGCEPDDIVIDMAVHVRFVPVGDLNLPFFEPAK
jgi:uncharacterized protein